MLYNVCFKQQVLFNVNVAIVRFAFVLVSQLLWYIMLWTKDYVYSLNYYKKVINKWFYLLITFFVSVYFCWFLFAYNQIHDCSIYVFLFQFFVFLDEIYSDLFFVFVVIYITMHCNSVFCVLFLFFHILENLIYFVVYLCR